MKPEEAALPFPQFSYTAFKNRKGIPGHLMNNEFMLAIWVFTITVFSCIFSADSVLKKDTFR